MKATACIGNRRQQNYKEAKAARAAADSLSHGGKAIKTPRYSFGVQVFTVVTENAETRTEWP